LLARVRVAAELEKACSARFPTLFSLGLDTVASGGALPAALDILRESKDLQKLREDYALDSALALIASFAQDQRKVLLRRAYPLLTLTW